MNIKDNDLKIKYLENRLAELGRKYNYLFFYWKKRCAERKALSHSIKQSLRFVRRLENIEKLLANDFNRKKIVIRPNRAGNKKRYPVYMTHNDATRLRQLLRYKHKDALKNAKEAQ